MRGILFGWFLAPKSYLKSICNFLKIWPILYSYILLVKRYYSCPVLYIFFLFLPKMGKKRRKVSSLELVLLALVRHLKRQNKEFHMYPHSKINCSVYIVLNKSKQTNPSDLTDLHRNNGTQHYLIFHARAVANCCGLNECTLHASSLSARF